jgi:glycolate oxidase
VTLGTDALVARLEAIVGAARVKVGDARAPYEKDESDVGTRLPDAAVEVESAAEVEALVAFARETKTPLVGRGAGSGKSGGALAERGGVVVSFARMASIREIDPVDLVAVVEPGVVTGALHAAVEAQGLFYPPDPNSLDWGTLGGNVAHNAGGPRAVKYGVTKDWVLGTEVVLGTGARVRTGHRSIKGVAGYDLTALLVGSEGTLGLVTEITLQLVPKPPCVETALALFAGGDGEAQAMRAVNALFGAGLLPRACEFLDRSAMQAVSPRAPFAFPDDVAAALLLEVDGNAEGCARDLVTIEDVAMREGAREVLLAQSETQRANIWETRRLVSPSLRAIRPFKMSEDIAVPRRRMLEMVEEVRRIGDRFALPTAVYGHAGDGNLHVNLLFATRDDRATVDAALEAVLRAAVRLGGTITGEHGVGLAKKPYLRLEQAEPLIDAQRRVKAALDPDGILNPGKIFPD